jgi:membrane-associated phospholipid phosphatase
MRGFGSVVFIAVIFSPLMLSAQKPDTLIKKLDSLKVKADTAGQVNDIKQSSYNQHTTIDFPTYFILLGSTAKQQLTKPFHMRSKDWKAFGIAAVAIGGLSLTDESIQRSVLKLRNRNPSLHRVSHFVTNTGGPYEVITLTALTAYGLVFKKEKLKTSAILSSQSYLMSNIITSILKVATGRQRPYHYNPDEVEAEPKFFGPFHEKFTDPQGKKIGSSFPSGHTAGAFAAATVFAMEYRDRPLVKIIAYTSASLIGLSRITENKHWFSDVLTGAVLGYVSGRGVVNNYHRYATLQNSRKKRGSVSVHMSYQYGTVIPGVTYTFR